MIVVGAGGSPLGSGRCVGEVGPSRSPPLPELRESRRSRSFVCPDGFRTLRSRSVFEVVVSSAHAGGEGRRSVWEEKTTRVPGVREQGEVRLTPLGVSALACCALEGSHPVAGLGGSRRQLQRWVDTTPSSRKTRVVAAPRRAQTRWVLAWVAKHPVGRGSMGCSEGRGDECTAGRGRRAR